MSELWNQHIEQNEQFEKITSEHVMMIFDYTVQLDGEFSSDELRKIADIVDKENHFSDSA